MCGGGGRGTEHIEILMKGTATGTVVTSVIDIPRTILKESHQRPFVSPRTVSGICRWYTPELPNRSQEGVRMTPLPKTWATPFFFFSRLGRLVPLTTMALTATSAEDCVMVIRAPPKPGKGHGALASCRLRNTTSVLQVSTCAPQVFAFRCCS